MTCDASGVHLSSPYVQAEPDGVHVELVNRTGRPMVFFSDPLLNAPSPTGVSTDVEQAPPGQSGRSCGSPNWCDFPANAPEADFTKCVWYLVVDPYRYYVPGDLRCALIGGDWGKGSLSVRPSEPLQQAARGDLSGLKAADRLSVEGYPAAEPRTVGVERAGKFVATASYIANGPDSWVRYDLAVCSGTSIDWKPGQKSQSP